MNRSGEHGNSEPSFESLTPPADMPTLIPDNEEGIMGFTGRQVRQLKAMAVIFNGGETKKTATARTMEERILTKTESLLRDGRLSQLEELRPKRMREVSTLEINKTSTTSFVFVNGRRDQVRL